MTLYFNVRSLDGDIKRQMERETYPMVGDCLIVLDYPFVTRYRVDNLQARPGAMPHDLLEPVTVVLRREAMLEHSNRAPRSVRVDPRSDVIARLDKIGDLARTYIAEKLTLEICHDDFVTLCAGSGLTSNPAAFDLHLFQGIPMVVAEEGGWNATTAFTGFNDDMCVLYVTLPGGVPFVMEPRFLEIIQQALRGTLAEDEAVEEVCLHVLQGVSHIPDAVLHRIKNAVSLGVDGIMPPYDAAQELVKVTQGLAKYPAAGAGLQEAAK